MATGVIATMSRAAAVVDQAFTETCFGELPCSTSLREKASKAIAVTWLEKRSGGFQTAPRY